MSGCDGQRFGYPLDMIRSGRMALACFAAAGSLTACTSTSTNGGAPRIPAESTSPSAGPEVSSGEANARVFRCEDPDPSMLTMVKTAIAPHPGPVRGATIVRAAKTATGTWYVVGIDRAYAMDDGTATGGTSRSLALTNAPAGSNFIPLGDGDANKPVATSWERVSWTGGRLAAGQRALHKAVGCLDAVADKR